MIEKIKKEIQRQLQESEERLSHINARGFVAPNEEQLIVHLKGLLSFIDTLEVKEVDLEKEIRHYRMRNPIIQHREESLYDYMANVAKHFFELGMSVSNKQN